MLKLPEKFKADWIAALRDPKARQARQKLKTFQGMCCLGVACEVSGTKFFSVAGGYMTHSGAIHTPRDGDVQPEVLAVFNQKISDVIPGNRYDYDSGTPVQSWLARRNDNGWTFGQIAYWIEKHL